MSEVDFSEAKHTFVVSDIHLADIEEPSANHPLWKRFKRCEHFIDDEFAAFLEFIQKQAPDPIELVLNGDIFDFDSVMTGPWQQGLVADFKMGWIEKLRGLSAEEAKSRFKFKAILDAHPVWLGAIRNFVLRGNRLVIVTKRQTFSSLKRLVVVEVWWSACFSVQVRILVKPNFFSLKCWTSTLDKQKEAGV